jgi:hypothetical protein
MNDTGYFSIIANGCGNGVFTRAGDGTRTARRPKAAPEMIRNAKVKREVFPLEAELLGLDDTEEEARL